MTAGGKCRCLGPQMTLTFWQFIHLTYQSEVSQAGVSWVSAPLFCSSPPATLLPLVVLGGRQLCGFCKAVSCWGDGASPGLADGVSAAGGVELLTISGHPHSETLLQPTVLAAVPTGPINQTVLLARTGVGGVALLTSPEKAL